MAMPEHPGVLLAQPAPAPLDGVLRPPGDKSISHRALILSSIAEGQSSIEGLLHARDVDATLNACRQLGAEMVSMPDGSLRVKGVGREGLEAPAVALDMGNSGTAMRLLAGVLAAQLFDSVLIGDDSLSRRPMGRITEPLSRMGAVVRTQPDGCAPLHIEGGHVLRGIRYRSPVASAQVKSCILLAGLYAEGETSVSEPAMSRDHTERMLRAFGAKIPAECAVLGGTRLRGTDLAVPADFSSAAFFLAAGALVPESSVLLERVGLNPTRAGLLDALQAMACDVRVSNRRTFGVEPVADVEVVYRAGIRGIDVSPGSVPAMIDELPMLAAVAACADGTTRIRGAAELRVKESDRIAVMCAGLRALGVEVRELPDGMEIEGSLNPAAGRGACDASPVEVDAAGDHRCAMAFAVMAQALERPLRIRGAAHIATSYPGFVNDLQALGGVVRFEEEGEHA